MEGAGVRTAYSVREALAVMLDQVEGVQDRGPRGLPSAQLIEA